MLGRFLLWQEHHAHFPSFETVCAVVSQLPHRLNATLLKDLPIWPLAQ